MQRKEVGANVGLVGREPQAFCLLDGTFGSVALAVEAIGDHYVQLF